MNAIDWKTWEDMDDISPADLENLILDIKAEPVQRTPKRNLIDILEYSHDLYLRETFDTTSQQEYHSQRYEPALSNLGWPVIIFIYAYTTINNPILN